VSACVPVPDGQEFRVSVVGSSQYLTGADGGSLPVSSDGSTLVTTTDYSQAIPFRAALGKNGQITLLNVDGTTLYSDQDLTGSGDEPIYFDTLQTSEDSSMYPVQFCLQPDNTFVVQNLGTQDPSDDANIVQICPSDGAVYLHTASAAAIRGCNTVQLQIAVAPSVTSTSTSATSSTAPTATGYKEGKFRVLLGPSGTSGYMASYYGGTISAVPPSDEVNFASTSDVNQAVIFETVPGQSGLVRVYGSNGNALYPNQNRGSGGYLFANTQAEIDAAPYNPVLFFILQDNTITVRNLGDDQTDPADDSNALLLCPNAAIFQLYAANAAADESPIGCVAQTLTAEFVVPDASTTSTSTSVSSPTPPPYVPPVGCPASSVQIPDGQQFRIRSTLYPDRYVFTQTQGTTTNIADAYIFTVTAGGTGQISTISTSDGKTYDSFFVPYLTANNGYSTFYANADLTNQGWTPLQLCLQPDNTFDVHSVGTDGPGPDDANTAITCLNQAQNTFYDNGDNIAYFEYYSCFVDRYVYEPIT
jgi:hypothetical protein